MTHQTYDKTALKKNVPNECFEEQASAVRHKYVSGIKIKRARYLPIIREFVEFAECRYGNNYRTTPEESCDAAIWTLAAVNQMLDTVVISPTVAVLVRHVDRLEDEFEDMEAKIRTGPELAWPNPASPIPISADLAEILRRASHRLRSSVAHASGDLVQLIRQMEGQRLTTLRAGGTTPRKRMKRIRGVKKGQCWHSQCGELARICRPFRLLEVTGHNAHPRVKSWL
ncbi:hypothetical protein B0T14DRAFT_598576 [Immersiella caudata]|uniref:Uncharacterized protein n=1 Tax=Immersiella caudata TaxID=314043 RepID=A0AA39XGL7_9PEZI|nr:hypothetical protein B0T14DRAFT_598576 [Immersiella caudata]